MNNLPVIFVRWKERFALLKYLKIQLDISENNFVEVLK